MDRITLENFAKDCVRQYGLTMKALREFKEISDCTLTESIKIFESIGIYKESLKTS